MSSARRWLISTCALSLLALGGCPPRPMELSFAEARVRALIRGHIHESGADAHGGISHVAEGPLAVVLRENATRYNVEFLTILAACRVGHCPVRQNAVVASEYGVAYSTSSWDIKPLQRIINDRGISEYVRLAALRGLAHADGVSFYRHCMDLLPTAEPMFFRSALARQLRHMPPAEIVVSDMGILEQVIAKETEPRLTRDLEVTRQLFAEPSKCVEISPFFPDMPSCYFSCLGRGIVSDRSTKPCAGTIAQTRLDGARSVETGEPPWVL